jgi:hypothetical protein
MIASAGLIGTPDLFGCRSIVARSLIAGGLSTPFRDASAVVHLDWLDGAA